MPCTSRPSGNESDLQYRASPHEHCRIQRQRPQDKGKLYALHAPEVECIGKGKARRPYEFGVKMSLAITHQQELIVRAGTSLSYDFLTG